MNLLRFFELNFDTFNILKKRTVGYLTAIIDGQQNMTIKVSSYYRLLTILI